MAFVPALSLVATAAGAGMTAISQYNAGEYKSQVAKNNAAIMDMNAQYALEKGYTQSMNQDLKTKATTGAQKAAQAANGIDVNSGTTLGVRQSTEELGRMDALTILNNAQREKFGYEAKASDYLSESKLDKMSGVNGAISSLIGGVSGVSDKWLSYKQHGVLA